MIYCREGFFFPIYGLLLLVFVRSYVNGRMEILKLDKENTTEREPVSMSAHLSTNAPDFAVNASFHSPHSESSSFTHVHGTLHEIPLPDAQVQLLSFIRNVQIVKSSQKSRKKRGFSAMPDEEIPGLENIVDEVEESAAVKKKPRKTFGKQGVKKDADGGKEKGASAATTTTAAPEKKAPEASAKKNGRGTATPSSAPPTAKGGNETDKDKAPKAQANSAAAKPSAAASSTSEKGSNDGPDAKPPTSVKDKAPAAQVPQGPPMPPPGAIPAPAPQIPQIQVPEPSSPAEAARPSGMVSGGKIPNYKLIYFDARGICEPIRLLFHYAKVPFDDVRISRKQWLALKDSTVYGKVPILEVDGKPLTYCHTIARYLARQFGLAGVDSWEQAKVDEISDFHADVAMDLQPYMYVVAGFHQGDKHTLRQAIFLPNVEKHFPVYVNLLKLSGSGFFMPSGITWVDFVIAEYMTTVRHFEPQILDKYPAITKFVRKVQTQPQIFEYVTNREHQPVRK